MSRTFTFSEAQTLLPVLESLLRRAQEAAGQVAQCEAEMKALNQRIFFSGGMRVDVTVVARRRAVHEKAGQAMKDALAEVEAIGVQVQDLEEGVLDFPFVLDGTTALLCWQMGEDEIGHWHGVDEGFEERKVVDGRIRGSRIDRLN